MNTAVVQLSQELKNLFTWHRKEMEVSLQDNIPTHSLNIVNCNCIVALMKILLRTMRVHCVKPFESPRQGKCPFVLINY